MNRTQKNTQIMGNSVTETLNQNQSVWAGSALFSALVQEHTGNMASIVQWEVKQQQALEIVGIVRDKDLLRTLITDEIMRTASAIKAFAASTGNNQLEQSVTFKKSFPSMSDTEFFISATTVKDVAVANAASILPYGITNQMLQDIQLDLTAFDTISKKPKAMRGQVKVFTQNLKNAFSTMMGTLKKEMDRMVHSLYDGTEFAAAYFNSRIVYNYNEHTTVLRGTVEAENGKHVSDVIMELVDYPAPGEVSVRSTNSDGNYSFRKIDITTATLRVRAIGYTTAEYTVQVAKNKTTEFNITLIPEPVSVPA